MPDFHLVTPPAQPLTVERAELALLGHLLSGKPLPVDLYGLHASLFADPAHSRIFRAIQHRVAAGSPVTVASLADDLYPVGTVGKVGGTRYLKGLLDHVAFCQPPAECAAAVIKAWQRRTLITIGESLHQVARDLVSDAYHATDCGDGVRQALATVEQVQQVLADLSAAGKPEVTL